MRRNRLGYRKKALLALKGADDGHLIRTELQEDQASASLARWVYKHAHKWSDADAVEIHALQCLRFKPDDWVFDYLWSELRKRKAEDIGDWILVTLGAHISPRPREEVEDLIELYYDEAASLRTRASALFVINDRVYLYDMHETALVAARTVCEDALWNEKNPYARAGASWLAKNFVGFEHRIRELQRDRPWHITLK